MKKAFSLVELMIVVAILGILAAIAVPAFQGHVTDAKSAAARDNLRILRNTIGLYAAHHNDVAPGYQNDDPAQTLNKLILYDQLVTSGKYLKKIPENPFNGYGLSRMRMLRNDEDFPTEATGDFAWVYKPATKEIRLDWPGTDRDGASYYDY